MKQKAVLTKGKNLEINAELAFSDAETDIIKSSTGENVDMETSQGMFLSAQDAEEYRAYKRRKKVEEIMNAIAKSEASLLHGEDPQRVYERAIRLKQAAVKAPPTWLPQAKTYLGGGKVKIDCVIGGNGETLTRVKAYEMRVALRGGARELTVVIAPSLLLQGKYAEIKKELKKLSRIAKKATLKVWMSSEYPFATHSKIARICCEVGVKYFCVPYFKGCEKLRFDLINGCQMEISEVETLEDYRKLCEAGVGRIVTRNVWEIYCEWMKEADQIKEVGVQIASKMKTKDEQPLYENKEKIEDAKREEVEIKTLKTSSLIPMELSEKSGEKKTEMAMVEIPKTPSMPKMPAPTANLSPLEAEMRTGITHAKMDGSDLKFL